MKQALASRRYAAVTVEVAIVFPIVIFFVLALVVGSMGIFRYQEVCYLAREGSRYASVRGTDYQREVGKPAVTSRDVYDNAIRPRMMILDPRYLNYSVSWNQTNSPYSVTTNFSRPVGNTISVTVTYTWIPEMYLIRPITLSSTSTLPMSY